jgi:hypothetical protein
VRTRAACRLSARAGFDVLLTTDNNLADQQNLKERKIAIVVAVGPMGDPEIVAAISNAEAGSYTVIEVPSR